MIPQGVEIFMAIGAIDLRWGFNRLTALVSEHVGRDVRCGALFVFIGKRRDALKVLFFDGTGLCLFYKRLDVGLFRLPTCSEVEGATAVALDEEELNVLLDAIDLERPSKRTRDRRRRGRPPDTNLH